MAYGCGSCHAILAIFKALTGRGDARSVTFTTLRSALAESHGRFATVMQIVSGVILERLWEGSSVKTILRGLGPLRNRRPFFYWELHRRMRLPISHGGRSLNRIPALQFSDMHESVPKLTDLPPGKPLRFISVGICFSADLSCLLAT